MNRRSDWLMRTSFVLTTALLGVATQNWPLAAVLLFLIFASGPRRRFALDTIGQLILTSLLLAAAWLILGGTKGGAPIVHAGNLDPIAAVLALALVLIAISRIFLKDPWLGHRATCALLLLVLLATGYARPTWWYPILTALNLASILLVLYASDPGRPSPRALTPRHRSSIVIALILCSITAVSIATMLPLAYSFVLNKYISSRAAPKTGFSTRLELGPLTDMVLSNEVVLRVRGPRPDHLRGIVYNHYSNGRWQVPKDHHVQQLNTDVTNTNRPLATTIHTAGGDKNRYFIPLNAKQIQVRGGHLQYNRMGIVQPPATSVAKRVSFELGKGDTLPILPPTQEDLQLPEAIVATLTRISDAWTPNTTTTLSRLSAIEHRLQRDFAYSLTFERHPDLDPVIDFLTLEKRGQCEYFASAMALLGRALHVPSRVVSGYRVQEYNPIGDYYVVREKNAHSWVEMYLPRRGWQTFDPTPASSIAGSEQRQTGLADALYDFMASKMTAAWTELSELTTGHIAVFIFVLLFLWISVRLFRFLRSKSAVALAHIPRYDQPLPCLNRLLIALARQGEPIQQNETIEYYAARIASSPRLESREGIEAAHLLNRYAAWRYGNQGEAQRLACTVDSWIERQDHKSHMQ